MPDVSIGHNRCALLIIRTIIREISIYFYVRYGDMEKVYIHPAALIKPYLHKNIRVVLATPRHITGARIKVTPEHLISSGSRVLSAKMPDCINGTFLNNVDYAANPEIVDCGIA
jgi:hypothetical protein